MPLGRIRVRIGHIYPLRRVRIGHIYPIERLRRLAEQCGREGEAEDKERGEREGSGD